MIMIADSFGSCQKRLNYSFVLRICTWIHEGCHRKIYQHKKRKNSLQKIPSINTESQSHEVRLKGGGALGRTVGNPLLYCISIFLRFKTKKLDHKQQSYKKYNFDLKNGLHILGVFHFGHFEPSNTKICQEMSKFTIF